MLQKVWDIISSSETNEHQENVLVKNSQAENNEFVVPQWHKEEIISRRKTAKNEYLPLSTLDQEIKLG